MLFYDSPWKQQRSSGLPSFVVVATRILARPLRLVWLAVNEDARWPFHTAVTWPPYCCWHVNNDNFRSGHPLSPFLSLPANDNKNHFVRQRESSHAAPAAGLSQSHLLGKLSGDIKHCGVSRRTLRAKTASSAPNRAASTLDSFVHSMQTLAIRASSRPVSLSLRH